MTNESYLKRQITKAMTINISGARTTTDTMTPSNTLLVDCCPSDDAVVDTIDGDSVHTASILAYHKGRQDICLMASVLRQPTQMKSIHLST